MISYKLFILFLISSLGQSLLSASSPSPSSFDFLVQTAAARTKELSQKELNQKKWDNQLKPLKNYEREFGNLKVPGKPKNFKYKTLGGWVAKQRGAYNKQRGAYNKQQGAYKEFKERKQTSITDQRIQRLNDINFVWVLKEDSSTPASDIEAPPVKKKRSQKKKVPFETGPKAAFKRYSVKRKKENF